MAALKTVVVCGLVAVVAIAGVAVGLKDSETAVDAVSSLPPEKLQFEAYDLVLQAVDGQCSVEYRSGEKTGDLALGIKPPCRFMRPDDGPLEVYREKGAAVFAIVGGRPEFDELDPLRTTRADCGTQVAAVIYANDAFRTADYIAEPVRSCAFMGMDQKGYWLFLNG